MNKSDKALQPNAYCADFDQSKREDVRQTRILIACVNAYLKLALQETELGKTSERATTNVLEALWEICTDQRNRKAAVRFKLKLEEAFPAELESTTLGKIQRFCEHRLPTLKNLLRQDRSEDEIKGLPKQPDSPASR